jgi:hypothetical protein
MICRRHDSVLIGKANDAAPSRIARAAVLGQKEFVKQLVDL